MYDLLIHIESILIYEDVNYHVKSDKSHVPCYSNENTIHEVIRKSHLNNKALAED